MILLGLIFLILVMMSAVYSGTESGLYSLERVRVQLSASEGDPLAKRLLAFLSNPGPAVCTLLLANNLTNFAVTEVLDRILRGVVGPGVDAVELELLNAAYAVPALFIFGEVVPKALFLRHPQALVPRVLPVFRITSVLLWPLTFPLLFLLRHLGPKSRVDDGSLLRRQALAGVLTVSDEAEQLTNTQRTMAGRLLAFRLLKVADRMIPEAEVASVSADADRAAILARGAQSGRSRLLVKEGGAPGYLGFVSVLDAAVASAGVPGLARRAVHDMPTLDVEVPLNEALKILQRARRPLGLVSKSGVVSGIIATTDIVDALLAGSSASGLEKADGVNESPEAPKI